MGWSYRKRLRFGPLNVNLSRSGIGTSLGIPGLRVTNSSTGRHYITLSLPGTGLSWRKNLGGRKRGFGSQIIPPVTSPQPVQTPSPLLAQSTPFSSQASTGSSGPLVNGMPWWQQAGMKKGPGTGP